MRPLLRYSTVDFTATLAGFIGLKSRCLTDGLSDFCRASGASEDVGVLALGFFPEAECEASSQSHGESVTQMYARTMGPDVFTAGTPLGAVINREALTTDAALRGWGSIFEGRSVNGTWPSDAQSCSYKLPGITAGVPSFQTLFFTVAAEQSCLSQNTQYNSGGIYKPTGGHPLGEAAQTGSQSDNVEQCTFPAH
ncbi:hypothetical protein GOODEAATRI_031692 [Goodea atripinnis]|uniref:Androgen receptor n=1 Tax=Goodea atripinnis TaxID=208336 RepID=A0ABV0P9G1_9TELE